MAGGDAQDALGLGLSAEDRRQPVEDLRRREVEAAPARSLLLGEGDQRVACTLGVAQTRQVLDLVKRLAERDLGVVIVTHNLHDVFEVADRITVLRLGQRVALLDRKKTTQQEVVQAITAGTLDHVPGMLEEERTQA